MSGGAACQCSERLRPANERHWRVLARRCNYSAFNGYHYTPSNWSHMKCLHCRASWRTKAKYVADFRDATEEELLA